VWRRATTGDDGRGRCVISGRRVSMRVRGTGSTVVRGRNVVLSGCGATGTAAASYMVGACACVYEPLARVWNVSCWDDGRGRRVVPGQRVSGVYEAPARRRTRQEPTAAGLWRDGHGRCVVRGRRVSAGCTSRRPSVENEAGTSCWGRRAGPLRRTWSAREHACTRRGLDRRAGQVRSAGRLWRGGHGCRVVSGRCASRMRVSGCVRAAGSPACGAVRSCGCRLMPRGHAPRGTCRRGHVSARPALCTASSLHGHLSARPTDCKGPTAVCANVKGHPGVGWPLTV